MERNGLILSAVCTLLFLSFNFTFPLTKETSTASARALYANQTLQCGSVHHETIAEKTKNIAAGLQNAIRKIRNSTQKEIGAYLSLRNLSNKNILSEEDLRQYEQLVIMKKYPFLDIKELEMKYSPTSNKDTRQSVKFHSRVNIEPDSGICEPVEDMNVEISNRGLSGFAIPTQFVKHLVTTDNKLKVPDLESNKQKLDNTDHVPKKSSDRNILEKLKDDINMFIDKKERQ